MRQLYLFWNRNVRNFAPVIQFFHTYAESFFTPVPIPLSVEQCIDPDGYTRKESCYICPCTSKMDGEQLFEDMQLGGVVNFLAFRQAVAGYNLIKQKSKSILTLIDFTKPSTEKRLFVFDMEQKKMLYSSVVSHGKNSGENYATSFSNEVGSYKSSLGFYLTGNTYQGRNGYSLYWTGWKKESMTGPVNVHRSSWRRIRQPFRLQIRQTGTKLRLSGFTTGTDQTYYQYDKRGKRTLYLCQ